MSVKGDAARQRILETARGLFASKGFSRVTMKDICEGVGMSRGGVYRHYPSTEAIFAAIIEDEQKNALASLRDAEKRGISPQLILLRYLRGRIELGLAPEKNIENAISEYAANSEEGKRILVNRGKLCLQIVTEQIDRGIALGVFACGDSTATAKHIIWLLEGMAKHMALFPSDSEDVESLLEVITGILGCKDK